MTKQGATRGNLALRLAAIRQVHSYLGVFIAPSVLFFALTGSAQLYRLHEAEGAYHPPAIVEKLGMVHKDQVFKLKPKRAPKPQPVATPEAAHEAEHEAEHAKAEAGPKASVQILRALFLIVALALAASTLLGVWMALAHGRHKRISWALLVAGAVLPVLILALG